MLHACERVRVRVADHFLTIWHPDVPRNHVRTSFFVARGRDPGDPLGMRGREAGKVCLFLTSLVILVLIIVSFAFHASGGGLRALMSQLQLVRILALDLIDASIHSARAPGVERELLWGFLVAKAFCKSKISSRRNKYLVPVHSGPMQSKHACALCCRALFNASNQVFLTGGLININCKWIMTNVSWR